MALEDNLFIEGENGFRLNFSNKEAKQEFLERLAESAEKSRLVREEGYKCGHCAAYPCFRYRGENDNAGLCFQSLRQCRQECDNYNYKRFPADGGICRKLNMPVKYEQLCITEAERLEKLKKSGK